MSSCSAFASAMIYDIISDIFVPNASVFGFIEVQDLDMISLLLPSIVTYCIRSIRIISLLYIIWISIIHTLQVHHDDSSDKLPDTLDIGDVPEPEELKKTRSELGASTSGSSSMRPKS